MRPLLVVLAVLLVGLVGLVAAWRRRLEPEVGDDRRRDPPPGGGGEPRRLGEPGRCGRCGEPWEDHYRSPSLVVCPDEGGPASGGGSRG